MDIFWDYGPGKPRTRNDLYGEFVELRGQYLSGMATFSWAGGGAGSYDRAGCENLMRMMTIKISELDGVPSPAGDNRIRQIKAAISVPGAGRGHGWDIWNPWGGSF